MQIENLKLIYFSPTGTTKKILNGIADGIQADNTENIDLTQPSASRNDIKELNDELVIFGAPVYAGRIPPDAVKRIRRFKARNIPTVIVVVYGNRAFDDALLELRDLAIEIGAVPVAGGAFIGEHSFSTDEIPIAKGRPDDSDLEIAREFGDKIRKEIDSLQKLDDQSLLRVPGNFPYLEFGRHSLPSPETIEPHCTLCGYCASVCPTAAIVIVDSVFTDPKACIRCCACVRYCPSAARILGNEEMKQRLARFSEKYRERKEPELFFLNTQ